MSANRPASGNRHQAKPVEQLLALWFITDENNNNKKRFHLPNNITIGFDKIQ